MRGTIATLLCVALLSAIVVVAATRPEHSGKPGKPSSSPGRLTFTDDTSYLWRSDLEGSYIHDQDGVKTIVNGVFGGIQFATRFSPRNVYLGFNDWVDDGDNTMQRNEIGAWFTQDETGNWIPCVEPGKDARPSFTKTTPNSEYDFGELQLWPDSVPHLGKGNPRERGTMEDMAIGQASHCRFGCFLHSAEGTYLGFMSHYGESWFHTGGDLTMTRLSEYTWLVRNTGYVGFLDTVTEIEYAIYMPFEFTIERISQA